MRCSVIGTTGVSLSVHSPGLVIRTYWASLLAQCTDNEVFTDKFGTDSESDKGGLVIGRVRTTRP